MINKDSVKNRINRIGQGMSFTEFSYSLLQAYDFFILNQKYQVCLQIGGSDQWGNISSGINLIRRINRNQVFGLTVPLLTQSNGVKFGKTEQGPIWLDPKKTSPYTFYQFWVNIDDKNVYPFLKWFTFFDYSKLMKMENEGCHVENICKDKIILAKEITNIVHGEKGLKSAVRITSCLFSNCLSEMTELDFEQLKQDGIPSVNLLGTEDLQTALIVSSLSYSKSQSRNMIISNAISINAKKISDVKYCFSNHDKIFGKYTLLQRGKKKYSLLCWK
jgi:tyrosyl-tRNA synthetase